MYLDSNRVLTSQENQQLKLGLNYFFVDKNKNTNRCLAAKIETDVERVKKTPLIKNK